MILIVAARAGRHLFDGRALQGVAPIVECDRTTASVADPFVVRRDVGGEITILDERIHRTRIAADRSAVVSVVTHGPSR
jgi:hypothetical protein